MCHPLDHSLVFFVLSKSVAQLELSNFYTFYIRIDSGICGTFLVLQQGKSHQVLILLVEPH